MNAKTKSLWGLLAIAFVFCPLMSSAEGTARTEVSQTQPTHKYLRKKKNKPLAPLAVHKDVEKKVDDVKKCTIIVPEPQGMVKKEIPCSEAELNN